MTDDEILAMADKIRARRLNQARLDSFLRQEQVMIRWNNEGARFGESYTGIDVPAVLVADVVRAHFLPLVTK